MWQRQEVQEVLPGPRVSPAVATGPAVRRALDKLAQSLAPQIRSRSRRLQPLGVAGLELREDHGPLGVAGDGTGQALQDSGCREGVLAAQVLDDALLGAAVLAHGLDQVEVGVAVDAL